MIFRLSQKLNTKVNGGTLATLPQEDNPFADWSAGLFVVQHAHYVLVSNTISLFSVVLPGNGITNSSHLVERALNSIQEILELDGQEGVFQTFIAPVLGSFRLAKALSRSVTGSMNDMIKHATYWISEGNRSLDEVASRLNEIPMSALARFRGAYGIPRNAFRQLASNSKE